MRSCVVLWFGMRAEREVGVCSGFELCGVDEGATGSEKRDLY
jgi:hypothetical protein